MAGNNFCLDLRLKTECVSQLDLTPDPDTPFQSRREGEKILVLCHAGGTKNICIVVGSDGTYSGLEYPNFGSSRPEYTLNGLRFNSFKWTTDGSSPIVTVAFGENGDEKLADDINRIVINYNNSGYFADWDDISKTYISDDQNLVDDLINVNTGDEICLYIGAIPDTVILYSFSEMLIGGSGC